MTILIENVSIYIMEIIDELDSDKRYHFLSDFNSMNKVNPIQHHTPTNENNFIGSLTNYMLPSRQGMLPVVPAKNMDMHCSHYIMPNSPVDYTPNLGMWDSSQVSSNMTNGISNTKKVT